MSTIRVAKRQRFTTIDRRAVNNDDLSFRARGILVWLLDKPDDWSCTSESLARSGAEGRDAIRTALKELEEGGYLERIKRQDEKGHWSTEWVIHEHPTGDGFPVIGDPTVGEPGPITEDCLPMTEDRKNPPNPPRGEGDCHTAFDMFWKQYPRKVGKPAALRAFKKAIKGRSNEELATLAIGLQNWVEFWADDGTDERHIPHPSTWLNQERWNDRPPAPNPKKPDTMDLLARAARGELR